MEWIPNIKKQIEKSGYPLEIEISALLDKDWCVTNSDSYFDADEEKTRDIDINSSQCFLVSNKSLFFSANLTIECKKSEKFAWVFFTRPLNRNLLGISGQYFDGGQATTKSSDFMINKELILDKTNLHYWKMKTVAGCYSEYYLHSEEEKDHRKDIFEAQNQLKKFIIYNHIQQLKEEDRGAISFFFPCIIFDGKMLEAQVKVGKVELAETQHVLLSTSNPVSYSTWDLGFLIDVVSREYAEEYFSLVKDDVKKLFRKVEKNKHELFNNLVSIKRKK